MKTEDKVKISRLAEVIHDIAWGSSVDRVSVFAISCSKGPRATLNRNHLVFSTLESDYRRL